VRVAVQDAAPPKPPISPALGLKPPAYWNAVPVQTCPSKLPQLTACAAGICALSPNKRSKLAQLGLANWRAKPVEIRFIGSLSIFKRGKKVARAEKVVQATQIVMVQLQQFF